MRKIGLAIEESRKPMRKIGFHVRKIGFLEKEILILEREISRFPRDSLVSGNFGESFSYAIGSMCAYIFTLLNSSTHNLK
jgi:hypothetical protein